MATQVSLFRSNGSLYVSRQAAIRQAIRDAFDGYEPDDPTVDPATLVAAATIDTQGTEVLGTVDPDNPEHKFHTIPLRVPEGWEPQHELSVPMFGWLGSWQTDRRSHDSRQSAFRRMVELNDQTNSLLSWAEDRVWWVVTQSGDPIPEESTDTFVFEGDRGIIERCQQLPMVLVLPTADEVRDGLAHLVDYRAQEAAENVARGQQNPPSEPAENDDEESGPVARKSDHCEPIERTNGHAAGHCDPKRPAKRQTLTQILRANGFDKFVGGEMDERTQTFDLEFDVAGPWYVPAIDDRIDLEGILLALATDLEETARKFRKAAANGLARPGDDEEPDEDTEVEEEEEADEPTAVVGGVA
jgi:hypothetical protein